MYLISIFRGPGVVKSLLAPLIPPVVEEDSSYVFSQEDFIKKLEIIHGSVDVQDSCTYGFGNGIKVLCPSISYTVRITAKIKYKVPVDKSIIQVNNDSKTFVIDGNRARLSIDVTEYEVHLPDPESYYSSCFTLTPSQIASCRERCEANFKTHLPELQELATAQKSLEELINTQLLILIKKGYMELE